MSAQTVGVHVCGKDNCLGAFYASAYKTGKLLVGVMIRAVFAARES